MTAPHRVARRSRYSGRRHQVDTRPTPLPNPADDAKILWYRGDQGDHAFGGGTTGFLRSKCGEVRWTVRQHVVEGTVRPCAACLAAIDPLPVQLVTESELRAIDGNR